ncbi:CDP-alcohol phosphatidyltransferase family protein [Candidatus Pelagibacter sp. HIMB1623]|uniref:CDP-alcohol phosphatidyltransferase family protein n=1 Tax=Candidatus Pelagibacter sp. HIMB1623 TaxID=3413358 RepID=UPI003F852DA9
MKEGHQVPQRDNFFEDIYSRAANKITPFFLNFTPNQVTILSGFFGMIGSFLLIFDNYLTLFSAAILIQLFSILDLVDGNIARIKNLQSKFGMWLDIFFDKLVDLLIIFIAPLGVYLSNGDPNILIWGIVLMGSVFFNQLIMILNNTKNYFEFSRGSGSKFTKIIEGKNSKLNFFFKFIYFFRKHLTYQHNTFLFLISFFAIIDEIPFGIYFLTLHSLISLLLSIIINFIKIGKD